MQHVTRLRLKKFKGIEELECSFDAFTLLVGPNNCGKTTVLQAIHLVISTMNEIARLGRDLGQPARENRRISILERLQTLGMHDVSWMRAGDDFRQTEIEAEFADGLIIRLEVFNETHFAFEFSQRDVNGVTSLHVVKDGDSIASVSERVLAIIKAAGRRTAELVMPPGDVSSREGMLAGNDYSNRVLQGQGAQYWRNGIWWAIQKAGAETFEPLRASVRKHFPAIDLLLPTLSHTQSPPDILMKYREGVANLDIAQSGAGLRTFVSLTRALDQSDASIVLFDEPDSHLHSQQQAMVLDLLMRFAATTDRQVIASSHSPELIQRCPDESIRWISGDATRDVQDRPEILRRLGATPEIYLPAHGLPDVLIYVEGKTDRPVIERLISWCRSKSGTSLPSTMIIPHRDGRFDHLALQSLARYAHQRNATTRLIGIRDLDWYYPTKPSSVISEESKGNAILVTLPCKEIENLFCDDEVLSIAVSGVITHSQLSSLVDEESLQKELVDEWRHNVLHRIRDARPSHHDPKTREEFAENEFASWKNDRLLRRRLVAGKALLGNVRRRLKERFQVTFDPRYFFDKTDTLPNEFAILADVIFPNAGFKKTTEPQP